MIRITFPDNSIREYESGITGIEIATLPKLTYIKGEELDLTGSKIIVTYNKGTEQERDEIEITEEMVSGYDKEKLGEQEIIVTFGVKTATFKVTVTNTITKIAIKSAPTKVTYVKGENLELYDFMTGKVVYNNICNGYNEFSELGDDSLDNLQMYKYE